MISARCVGLATVCATSTLQSMISRMEVRQYLGPVFSSLCPGALDVVEVCYRSGHCKLHGAEFSHQALQFLPAHPALRGRDGEQLEELQVFLLWKGNHDCLRVNPPPQHIFF